MKLDMNQQQRGTYTSSSDITGTITEYVDSISAMVHEYVYITSATSQALGFPEKSGYWCHIFRGSSTSAAAMIVAVRVNASNPGWMCIKQRISGTWSEWQWVKGV